MKVSINFKKKKAVPFQVKPNDTVGYLREQVASFFNLSLHRVELRGPPVTRPQVQTKYNDLKKNLEQAGIADGTELYVKDLGPQVGYRTVFVVEYLGPIVILLLFALRPSFLFGPTKPLNFIEGLTEKNMKADEGTKEWNIFVQSLAFAMWLLHFAKREFETFFIHKFSRPTMPLFNIFKNSMYYWGFAAGVGYFLVHPLYTAPSKTCVLVGFALWVVAQTINFSVHYQLSTMRKSDGDTSRKAPSGILFSLVCCPNYTAEVLGWVAWSLLSSIAMGWFFTIVGFAQMTEWALAKHRGYLKPDRVHEDKEYKARRLKAIVPFLL